MTSNLDAASHQRPIHSRPLAALAAAGAAAVGVAWAAQAFPRISHHLVARRQQRALVTYLRDHLSGSDAGIQVVRKLAATDDMGADRHVFSRLADEFEQERSVVRRLLEDLGSSSRSPRRVAGHTAGALLSGTAGGRPGELSLLRTLEALAIAVQGKRCLWRALQALGAPITAEHRQFLELEAQAVRQWEALEGRRWSVAQTVFPTREAQTLPPG